ncbi:cytidylate kinase-like family protein [Desulfogranum mediterraneum]|uniref:cytidylate kinase-like family protein n=1 Tax=Desulfogranum mediterraneum TaxID=160661 RepID=UPI00041567E1|nr:cytidylate kinase-like family protein [Desulfogranum mediterraneum]
MAIITISKGSYSHGQEVAEALADRLGYECVSRDILVEASEEFNIPEIKLAKALYDAPSVLERFTHGRERYISYFQSAFLNHISRDNVVYHGLAGHFFIQDIPQVLKVRIIADIEDRLKEEARHQDCTREEARYRLKRDDEERRRWSLQNYGMDIWDSSLYDLVIKIGRLSIDDAVDFLAQTVEKQAFQSSPESIQALKERALLANVFARLALGSPRATVRLVEPAVIALGNLEGVLKTDEAERNKLVAELQGEYDLKEVVFDKPTKMVREYVNVFHNLDLS